MRDRWYPNSWRIGSRGNKFYLFIHILDFFTGWITLKMRRILCLKLMIQLWASAPSSPQPRPPGLNLSVEIKKMQLKETWLKRFWCFIQSPKYLFQSWNKIWFRTSWCHNVLYHLFTINKVCCEETPVQGDGTQGIHRIVKVTQHSVSTRQCCWQGTEPVSRWPGDITTTRCVVSPGQPIRDHNLTFRLQSGSAPRPRPDPGITGITSPNHNIITGGNTNVASLAWVARWDSSCFAWTIPYWSKPNEFVKTVSRM